MNKQQPWHDQDNFWELFEPYLFNEERLSRTKEEVEQIISLVMPQPHERFLDLCCGIGRHSLALARLGFEVVGVDRTHHFIQKAGQIAEDEALNAAFITSDMREFCRPEQFDVVINMFGSFGYFEDQNDNRKVACNMFASLRSGGRFLIETNGKEIEARDFQPKNWFQHGDSFVLLERRPVDDWRRIYSRWIVIKDNQPVEHSVSVCLYSAKELCSLLFECGVSEVHVYGSLAGIEYNHLAKRLVVIAYKA